jgi:RimJ/RimL family protein N-acetyltransferase
VAEKPVTALRDVTESDLPVFYEQQLDPEATEMAAFPARDREAFDAHWKKILKDETVRTKTIVADGAVAGNVVSFPREGRTEIGYWLGREFWGRGLATRALEEFLAAVDERPLYAGVAKHNAGSIRVLEKCGFVRRGAEKDGMLLYELR